jgi:hypothetical protein
VILPSDLGQGRFRLRAGRVEDEHLDRTESIGYPCNEIGGLLLIGDIGCKGVGHAAVVSDRLGDFESLAVTVQTVHRHGQTVTRKPLGNRSAQPARASRHERDPLLRRTHGRIISLIESPSRARRHGHSCGPAGRWAKGWWKASRACSGADGEQQHLLGFALADLHAGAVVVRAPVEGDLEAAADAAGELATRLDECEPGISYRRFDGRLTNWLSHGRDPSLQLLRRMRRGPPSGCPLLCLCGLVAVAGAARCRIWAAGFVVLLDLGSCG